MSTARSFKSLRAVFALILREMATTYGRSSLGFLWTILEPVLGIAFLSIIFSLAFRSPSIGSNFPLFYATGILPFLVYRDLSTKVATSLRFSKQLLFYPAITFWDALVARLVLNFLVHIIIFYVVISGIFLAFDVKTTIHYPPILFAMLLAAFLGFGLGVLNCFLFSVFPSWERFWGVLNRPMFILSCVLFTFETVPEPYRSTLWYNPVVHIVGLMRSGFYPSYDANYASPLYVCLFAFVSLNVGLVLLARYHRDILNY